MRWRVRVSGDLKLCHYLYAVPQSVFSQRRKRERYQTRIQRVLNILPSLSRSFPADIPPSWWVILLDHV